MNNLILRSITGLVFVASILLPLFLDTIIAVCVFSAYFVLGIIEFYKLFSSSKISTINWQVASVIAAFIFGIPVLISLDYLPFIASYLILPVLIIGAAAEIWRKSETSIQNAGILVFGVFYLVLPFLLMIVMTDQKVGSFPFLAGMFFLIWTNDTFAYLSGRIFGKTKLFERISPKKTWEGTIGGVLFTLIVAFFISYFTSGDDLIFWMISGIIIAPCAIVGDLFESMIKRQLGVKDSGTILPGHGGILDRFDATIFSVVFFFGWYQMYLFMY